MVLYFIVGYPMPQISTHFFNKLLATLKKEVKPKITFDTNFFFKLLTIEERGKGVNRNPSFLDRRRSKDYFNKKDKNVSRRDCSRIRGE